ncbi:MAG TPA: hypothetical protein DCL21_06585 [Alphaproteobacteria bacterium]|nr:hypothetical protein [Alphaproteobacteria bacterium]
MSTLLVVLGLFILGLFILGSKVKPLKDSDIFDEILKTSEKTKSAILAEINFVNTSPYLLHKGDDIREWLALTDKNRVLCGDSAVRIRCGCIEMSYESFTQQAKIKKKRVTIRNGKVSLLGLV